MKHINLTEEINGLSEFMVTQESNNYGDQILSLKQLITTNHKSYYRVISITSRPENEWMQFEEMVQWKNDTLKRLM